MSTKDENIFSAEKIAAAILASVSVSKQQVDPLEADKVTLRAYRRFYRLVHEEKPPAPKP